MRALNVSAPTRAAARRRGDRQQWGTSFGGIPGFAILVSSGSPSGLEGVAATDASANGTERTTKREPPAPLRGYGARGVK
jgi:hypothetical protein